MTKKRTAAEYRREGFLRGFSAATELIKALWRHKIRFQGLGRPRNPAMYDLWDLVERLDKLEGLYSDDVKEDDFKRLGGTYDRLRYRVKIVRKTHPWHGQTGFVLWSEAFREQGISHPAWMVHFEKPVAMNSGIAWRALAMRDDWEWIDKPPKAYRTYPPTRSTEQDEP